MIVRNILTVVFLVAGFMLMAVSAIGVLRLPDFFSRLHASSIGETLGIVLAGIGFMIYEGVDLVSLKILMIIAALFLVNPVGTHLIGKAALHGKTMVKEEEKYANISH